MNIVFYHNNGIIPTAGGISKITYNLTSLFREHGHNVYLIGAKRLRDYDYDNQQSFLPNENLMSDENIDYLVEFCRSNKIDFIINQASLNPVSVSFIANTKGRIEAKIISCIHNSILVQAYNYADQKEYSLKKKKLDVVYRILRSQLIKKFLTYLFIQKGRKKYQRIVSNSDYVVLLTNGQLKELESICGMSNIPNAKVIPNCIYSTFIKNKEKSKKILWVGTIDFSVKRIDLMLKIWKKVQDIAKDWSLEILGSGSYLEEAKKLSKNMGLERIVFTGRVSPESYYDDAQIVCVTSTHESFSLVTIEGMSHGCVPILFKSFPAAEYIVKDGVSGLLCKPFNVDEFAENLLSCIKDENRRYHLMSNAFNRSLFFSADNIYSMWSKIIG